MAARGKAGDGKAFEQEIGKACEALGCWSRNSNDPNPSCDRMVCLPLVVGHPVGVGQLVIGISVLLECKETRDGTMAFARISEAERRAFTAHRMASGLGYVLIKDLSKSKPRVFACEWGDWLELESEMGWAPPVNHRKVYTPEDLPTARPARRKGQRTCSILLCDDFRPSFLTEIFRLPRDRGLGLAWDLAPVLKGAIR